MLLSTEDFEAKQILFLVPKEGEKLSFRNDNIIVTEKFGKIKHQSTCYRLFAVFIVGHITITSGLIQRAKKFGFAIILMTASYRPYQVISAAAEGNVILRKRQYDYSDINAAKILTENKMQNQRKMLMSIREKNDEILNTVKLIDEYIYKLSFADSVQSIMGYEGCASRVYFKAYFNNVVWKCRKPRTKFDMTNALLDIGYTTLFSYVDAVASLFGFDRYCGVLHRQFYMRKSLICDLVEPFRVIVDRQVKKGINLGQFKEKDFEVFDGRYCLKYSKSSEYGGIFIKAIMEHKTDIYEYVREVYRTFMKGKIDTDFPIWEMR